MEFKDLSEELKAKVAACKSTEELLALAKAEGHELSENELAKLSAGSAGWGVEDTCPNDTTVTPDIMPNGWPY